MTFLINYLLNSKPSFSIVSILINELIYYPKCNKWRTFRGVIKKNYSLLTVRGKLTSHHKQTNKQRTVQQKWTCDFET